MRRRDILAGSGAVALAGVGAAWLGARRMGSMGAYVAAVAATRSELGSTRTAGHYPIRDARGERPQHPALAVSAR